MPVGRLLVEMSVPMMVSFFIQALYNIIDSIFVSWISEDALTAVSMAFPVQIIITALGVGTGTGIMAQISKALGREDPERASRYANVSVFLNLLYSAAFALFGIAASRWYYLVQTSQQNIIAYGDTYLSLICIVSVGAFYAQTLEKTLSAVGHASEAMISQAVGAGVNILLDPLLIFGIGIFPVLGVRGAAIATVFGQCIAALTALLFNLQRGRVIRYRLGAIFPDRTTLREIYSVGVPSMITVGMTSVLQFFMNQILLAFSTTAVAVFGVWSKLQNFAQMPIFGMNNGTVPILSYNYGAGRLDRVRETIRQALRIGTLIMAAVTVLFECIPGQLLMLFNASDAMREIGIPALRIMSLSLLFGGISIILTSAYQSLGHSRYTLIITLARQAIVPLPIAFLLAQEGTLFLVWMAIPVSEAACMVFAAGLFPRLRQHVGL